MMSNQTSDLPLVGDKLDTNPFVDLTEDYKVLEWTVPCFHVPDFLATPSGTFSTGQT